MDHACWLIAFQSVIPRAVLLPERFRGGCAFGAGELAFSGLFRWGRFDETEPACANPRVSNEKVRIVGKIPKKVGRS